jgi:hypothetical protein
VQWCGGAVVEILQIAGSKVIQFAKINPKGFIFPTLVTFVKNIVNTSP